MTEPTGDVPQVSAAFVLDVGAVAPPQQGPDQPEQEDEGDE